MDARQLAVPGAWVFRPQQHPDARGVFLEWLKADVFLTAVGHPPHVAQGNHSLSRRGVLRGVHFGDVPPGQAKYVYCTAGAVLDVVVDLRVDSPTFGLVDAVRLDDVERQAVYLAEGLGHAFLTLSDEASVTYLCSTPYTPSAEHTVSAFDPDLAVPWPADPPAVLSERDAAAPSLAAAREAGLLPRFAACQARYEELRAARW